MEMGKTWTEVKNYVDVHKLALQYEEYNDTPARYFMYLVDGPNTYTLKMLKTDSDCSDFETNYKPNSNQTYKLAVDVKSINDTRFTPKFYKSSTNITLSDSLDTDLFNSDFNGKVDSITVTFSKDDIEFSLHIDGNEILRLELDEFDSYTNNITLDDKNKTISINWNGCPIDVINNLTVKAKKTTNGSTKMSDIFIVYREKVNE